MTREIRDLLGKFRTIEGIDMAAVVGIDGLIIESVAAKGIDADAISAVASHGLAMATALGRAIHKGGALQTLLEYEDGLVLLEPMTEDAMLLVLSNQRENLGRLRFLSKAYHAQLEAAVNAI